jgi:Fe-S-cluster containining protein
MAKLSPEEEWMFTKWQGHAHPWARDEFWDDVAVKYKGKIVELPMEFNPNVGRRLEELLKCTQCGECCKYDQIPIERYDLERIASSTPWDMHVLSGMYKMTITSQMYIPAGPKGCPFLADNKCAVYNCRPSVCKFFPIQSSNDYVLEDDKGNKQTMRRTTYSLKCRPAVDVYRTVIEEALEYTLRGSSTLLADLTLVDKGLDLG